MSQRLLRLTRLVRRTKATKTSSPTTTTAISTGQLQLFTTSPSPRLSRAVLLPSRSQPALSRFFSSTSATAGNFPFKLHDIGEGIAEVELIKWHVEVGQRVEEFDVLCEVQSDKSTVELTSPSPGIIRRLGAEEGVVVKVGQLICDIEVEGEGESEGTDSILSEPDKPPQGDTATASSSQSGPAEEVEHKLDDSLFRSADAAMDSAGGGQFHGEASLLPSPPSRTSASTGSSASTPVSAPGRTSGPAPAERVWKPKHNMDRDTPSAEPKPQAPLLTGRESTSSYLEGTMATPRAPGEDQRIIIKASPAVRTLAARMGVELSAVRATGEGGRVTKEDVKAYGGEGLGRDTVGSPVVPRVASGLRDREPTSTRVDFGRTRKVMFRAMGDMGSVPHFGYSHTLNLTPLLPYMRSLNPPAAPIGKAPYLASDIPPTLSRDPLDSGEGAAKTTILSFLVKAMLMAMEEHPIMRSRVKETDGTKWLDIARDGTIAVAVSDPKFGLLTPSLPALPPSTPLSSITSHLSALRKNASKPTPPGSLTISSVGPLGESRGAMPVLPPGGGVAICAVGRASWGMAWKAPKQAPGRGVWDWTPAEVEAGGAEAVLRCPVGWSGDHRVLEGAELIAFTETWKKYIEEPWRWIKVDG